MHAALATLSYARTGPPRDRATSPAERLLRGNQFRATTVADRVEMVSSPMVRPVTRQLPAAMGWHAVGSLVTGGFIGYS